MLTPFVRGQLAAFLVITIVGVTYASVVYADLPRLLGLNRYSVTMELRESGGLYPNAVVTYRGSEVGRVDRLTLGGPGVETELNINQDARIPREVQAAVRSTSAIGEQYVELTPLRADGPMLGDGERIGVERTTTPTDVATLLGRVNTLVASLPQRELRTVLEEADRAFAGTGDDLQRLIDSGGRLLDDANANFEPTVRLFNDLQPVLATQERTAAQVSALTGDLADVTDTTRRLDPNIRRVIDRGGPFVEELDALVKQLRPTLPPLLRNLANVGQVTTVYLNHIRQTLIVFPLSINDLQATFNLSPLPNRAALNFKLSVNTPPPCTEGFLDPSQRRDPNDFDVVPVPGGIFCRSGQDSPIGVRMAQNYDCPPGSPAGAGVRSPDARGCGLNLQSRQDERARQDFNTAVQNCIAEGSMPRRTGDPFEEPDEDSVCARGQDYVDTRPDQQEDKQDGTRDDALGAPVGTAGYAPETGTAIAPNGDPFVLGDVVAPPPDLPPGLGGFLLGPLARTL